LSLLLCAGCSDLPDLSDVSLPDVPMPRLFSKPPPDPATQMASLEARVFELIADKRHALDPNAKDLALDSELVGVARQRSLEMARKNSFVVDSSDPHIAATRLMATDAKFQGLLGENIAAQHYSKEAGIDVEAFAQRFLAIWLASPSHKDNLCFADYDRTGVGAAVSGDTVYVTQLFVSDTGFVAHKDDAPPPKVTAFPSATAAKASTTPKKILLRGSDTAVDPRP
jgi:uncharacterized protein YkwD